MIDLGFALLVALVSAGLGKRVLDGLKQTPDHPLDVTALALPIGMGLVALATLLVGQAGWLNFVGLSVLLGVVIEIGIVCWLRMIPELRSWLHKRVQTRSRTRLSLYFAFCLGMLLVGTALTALTPVTDGDALCYHLQVPKVFLMHESVGFVPDLHETVYPLVTEMLYLIALAFRGPVACRGIQWILGIVFAANVTALARPTLGRRAWWAGTIALLVPAVSNGMSAPLNDVALAAFGTAAIFAWVRLNERPSASAAVVAGLCAGLALGVKYPAIVLCALLFATVAARVLTDRKTTRQGARTPWLTLAAIYLLTAVAVGGCWYLRAFIYTGNPVFPYFRAAFGGAGIDEVLGASKRPLPVTFWNLITAIVPLSLQPDRFDSFSHQFGPFFLLFLPLVFVYRTPRRILALLALGYAFLIICLTQRQSMRFVLIAVGPMSIAVAYFAVILSRRSTIPARLMIAILVAAMGFQTALALARSRHALTVLAGRESTTEFLARREPTFAVGQWAAQNLPRDARLIGQDHRGFYFPRDYTMELAHRRRTGLGQQGESPAQIIDRLRATGFTHILFCPPTPEKAVEFDPTLGRLLGPWVAQQKALFSQDLTDGDGVVRHYAIYELAPERPAQQLSSRSDEGHAR
jgi:hypothetical protein